MTSDPLSPGPQPVRGQIRSRERKGGLGLFVVSSLILIAAFVYLSLPTVYQFRLEAAFMLDGEPHTAVGFMQCTYRRAWFTWGTDAYRLGEPIFRGYYTATSFDSPSVVLPDGKAAIMIPHRGKCPPLPIVQQQLSVNPREMTDSGVRPAYYFPDRNDPKVVWILNNPLPHNPNAARGRFLAKSYRYLVVSDGEPVPEPLEHNIPIAWRWYRQISDAYRTGEGVTHHSGDDWFGLFACVEDESEWRSRAEFAQVAVGLTKVTATVLREPGHGGAANCHGGRMPHVSLVPSEDYSKAMLDLDRAELQWATITTPYIAEHRDRELGRWIPEICVVGEGCTGIRMKAGFWIYLPVQRVFARIDESALETFSITNFALRPGDGQ
jgi:hypothetical protein